MNKKEMALITEKCSLFKTYLHKQHGWCFSTHPETVSIIDHLAMDWQPELSSKVRSIVVKDERDVFKKQLWGLTPGSVMLGGRGVKHIIEHSGLMAFDIDKYNDEPMTKEVVSEVMEVVKQIAYTLYCGRSASGLGVWGLFRISNSERYSDHFAAMALKFKNIGIPIDPAPSSIASLRFISYDPDHYINEDAKIFTQVIEPIIKEKKKLVSSNSSNKTNSDGKDLIKKFNSQCSAADIYTILENFGFEFNRKKGDHYYFTRPDKDVKAGISIDYHADKRTLYCFSSNVPGLEHWKTERDNGWSCSPLTALRLYGFGMPADDDDSKREHWAEVFKYIKSTV